MDGYCSGVQLSHSVSVIAVRVITPGLDEVMER